MRKLASLLVGLLVVMSAAGCANFRDRRWGMCALAGGIVGGTLGGLGGGLGVSEGASHPDDGDRAAGAGGGFAAGAVLGALIGHAICDPQKEVPPPPPVAPPPPPPAKGTKLGTVGEAYFDFDKADLKTADGARDVLAEVLRVMRDNPTLHVMVEGHTDSVGSDAYNQKLSERRANAVEAYLVRQGIDASRIDTRGYGETRPVATNSTAAGRAQNRRAEIIAE
jgi:OOP family OmpA-OmpF porin